MNDSPRIFSLFVIMTMLILAHSSPERAEAIVIRDQIHDRPFSAGSGHGNHTLAQTFTVGVGGTLNRVGMRILKTEPSAADVYLDILATDDGVPVWPSLGRTVIPDDAIPIDQPFPSGFVMTDVSDIGIEVNPGDVLAIAVSGQNPGDGLWLYSQDFYEGGRNYISQSGSDFNTTFGNLDYGFQTFVDAELSGPIGDFDNDQDWDCDDIDSLVSAIASGSSSSEFDMNGDGVVTRNDITDEANGWLAFAGWNRPDQTDGNAFLIGDANLDGAVDGLDFIVWNANRFTNTPAWCSGDFTAEGIVDGVDFNEWNENRFTNSGLSVPEPRCLMIVALIALPLFAGRN